MITRKYSIVLHLLSQVIVNMINNSGDFVWISLLCQKKLSALWVKKNKKWSHKSQLDCMA